MASAGQVKAGAAVLDGTYHVGNSAGQYASTKAEGFGHVDPHVQQVKNQTSYGVQARETVRALVVERSDVQLLALVHTDHYIPQDAILRRTAQLLQADPELGGRIRRPWLDATGQVTAHVRIERAAGGIDEEDVQPDAAGNFVSSATLQPGDVATVTVEDQWGNTAHLPPSSRASSPARGYRPREAQRPVRVCPSRRRAQCAAGSGRAAGTLQR